MDETNKNRSGPILITIAAVLWSFTGVCVKYVAWSAMSLACFRSICGVLIFMIYMKFPKLELNKYNMFGALCMLVTSVTYILANKLTTAANAVVLHYTAPLFVMLYSALVKKQRPTKADLIMCGTVILGCGLAFADKLDAGAFLGNVLAIISGISFAGTMVVNAMKETNSMQAQLQGNIITMVVLLPFLLTDTAITLDPKAWGAALFLGFIQYGLSHIVFSIGIKRISAISASLISTAEPICSPIWVFLVLGEKPGGLAFAGFVIVVAAVIVYNYTLMKKEKLKA